MGSILICTAHRLRNVALVLSQVKEFKGGLLGTSVGCVLSELKELQIATANRQSTA
jgi:hypothetical protein